MAVSKEKDFELEIRVVVAGFGKQSHWLKLAQEVFKAIGVRLGGEFSMDVTRVRVPGGTWYPCPIGLMEPFDFDSVDGSVG